MCDVTSLSISQNMPSPELPLCRPQGQSVSLRAALTSRNNRHIVAGTACSVLLKPSSVPSLGIRDNAYSCVCVCDCVSVIIPCNRTVLLLGLLRRRKDWDWGEFTRRHTHTHTHTPQRREISVNMSFKPCLKENRKCCLSRDRFLVPRPFFSDWSRRTYNSCGSFGEFCLLSVSGDAGDSDDHVGGWILYLVVLLLTGEF
jgi:hypothetical protein